MKKQTSKYLIFSLILIVIALSVFLILHFTKSDATQVKIITSKGEIVVELYSDKSPITVKNFLNYVDEGFYDGLVFHRVMDGFMIQGGGFNRDGRQKETHAPIILESNNNLSNKKYTVAMARTLSPNSATSQFFINTNDNNFLDYGVRDEGYAVFGKVVKGFDVVDEIEKSKTQVKYNMKDWPVEEIIIEKIEII